MATYHDIIQHPQYRERAEKQRRSLLTMDRFEMAQYAAESYAYWSLRAILAEQEAVADVITERRISRHKRNLETVDKLPSDKLPSHLLYFSR